MLHLCCRCFTDGLQLLYLHYSCVADVLQMDTAVTLVLQLRYSSVTDMLQRYHIRVTAVLQTEIYSRRLIIQHPARKGHGRSKADNEGSSKC